MKFQKIENLDNEIYHNSDEYSDFWSSSNIKNYLETPREAYFQKYVAEHETKEAWTFGTQLHDWLASKHVNGQPFPCNEFMPACNPKTDKPYGKDTKTYQNQLAGITNPITAEDLERITDIWRAFTKHPDFWFIKQNILNKGVAEPSIFCEQSDGAKYKYRPDVLTDYLIGDWKTITKNKWDERGIKSHVIDYGYDISASMYQYLEWKRTGIWKPFIIIWIMKDPPFDFLIDDISKYSYQNIGNNEGVANNGAMVFKKLKDQHEACLTTGIWPGLSSQYGKIGGVRMADYMPSVWGERSYEGFEIELKNNRF